MILYTVLPPVTENNSEISELFCGSQKGIPYFYRKNADGKKELFFSTDPKLYLTRDLPLQ